MMEENFLRLRQKREEERLHRSKEASEATHQRQQFEAQAAELETLVHTSLKEGDAEQAQMTLNRFRVLVQDTSNSVSLTAYEMARANQSLWHLQQIIDEHVSSAKAPAKFKFSSRAKANKIVRPTSSASPVASMEHVPEPIPSPRVPDMSPQGTVYGPASEATLYITPSKAVFINSCTDCLVLALPIAGSAFLSGCNNCTIYIACHQLRLKDCHNTAVYVWCASTPIIENCDEMHFGPYSCWKGLLRSQVNGTSFQTHEEWVERVGEIPNVAQAATMYTKVNDFQWLRKTASPHWRVIDLEEMAETDEPFMDATAHSIAGSLDCA